MAEALEALKRRLEGEIATSKAHSSSYVLVLLPAAEGLLAALDENVQLKIEVGKLLGLLLRAGTALVAERAGGAIDWDIGNDIDRVLPQGSAWEGNEALRRARIERSDAVAKLDALGRAAQAFGRRVEAILRHG